MLNRLPVGVGGIGDVAYTGIAKLHPCGLGAAPRRKPRGKDRPPDDITYNKAFSRTSSLLPTRRLYGTSRSMTLEAEVARLRDENQTLTQQVAVLAEQLKAAQQRIAELEQRRPDPPAFVKANRPKATHPKAARKKRDRHHNHNRTRAMPTRVVQHAFDHCPDCNYRLQGSTVAHRREVIELPDPQPVEVIEHQMIKRFCPHCQCYKQPALDLHGHVLGHGRIGVRVIALIAYLHTTLRLPIRRIVTYLATVHNLSLAAGTVVELLHQLRRTLEGDIADLKKQARASPASVLRTGQTPAAPRRRGVPVRAH